MSDGPNAELIPTVIIWRHSFGIDDVDIRVIEQCLKHGWNVTVVTEG